ncbi:hypothetical protein M0208_11750 [Sphingomonas sp. SUN019]|nr:hypothetical protein M0208_11750 [Sphingomonas sp. SUN019]
MFGETGADDLTGNGGADWFVFKGYGALDGGDRILDFENGIDRIVLEKLGVTRYAAGGAAGSVFATDLADGNVQLDVVTSAGAHFGITLVDANGTLNAAGIAANDFLFA